MIDNPSPPWWRRVFWTVNSLPAPDHRRFTAFAAPADRMLTRAIICRDRIERERLYARQCAEIGDS